MSSAKKGMATIVLDTPIETAQTFLRPRPRLCQRVPVSETVSFIYRFRDREDYYPDMKHFLNKMIEDVQHFFAQDMYDLTLLGLGLAERRYRITTRGRFLLEDRLSSTYSDGIGYRIQTDALVRVGVKPVLDLEKKIMRSSAIGYEAATLSRRIGREIGTEVCMRRAL
jgi:hypothetical protein